MAVSNLQGLNIIEIMEGFGLAKKRLMSREKARSFCAKVLWQAQIVLKLIILAEGDCIESYRVRAE